MKFKNMKQRLASTALAGVMAMSLAAPAFAAGNSTNISGSYRAITVAVNVPATGTAIINPYGLPVELGKDSGVNISGQQITTGAPLLVQNKSAVPLSVSASIASTVKGTFTFDGSAIADGETGNKGNVLFQMFDAPGVTEANASDMDVLNPMFAALDDADALCNTVLSLTSTSTPAVEEDDIVTLKAANAAGELVDGGAAFFRLGGTVAKKPTVAWTASDGFTSKVTFTFEPTAAPAELAGTVAFGDDTLDVAVTTSTTATLTPDLPDNVTVTTWSWTSATPAAATVTALADTKTATVTYAGSGSSVITVRGTGSDGITYEASATINCT